MADKLTPQQEMAVKYRGGQLLVSAAAGSGKTKVLVDRLMSYILDPADPANIDEFLIITYTKAAAAELRGKIAAKLSEHIAADPDNRHLQQQLQRLYLAKISTVHSFCGDILREYAYRLDIAGDFRVGDENECRELRNQVVTKLLEKTYDTAGEDPDFCAFVDTQDTGRADDGVAELVLKVYDSARCHLDPEKWYETCLEQVRADACTDASETVYGSYLLTQLRQELQSQIRAMEYCAGALARAEGCEKQAAVFYEDVAALRYLADSQTWDQVITRKDYKFPTLRFTKSCTDLALAEDVKTVRNDCKLALKKYLKPFADPSEKVLSDLAGAEAAARGLIALAKKFGAEYLHVKRGRQILDFSDLEHKMLDLLTGLSRSAPTVPAAEVGSRFREVMVDEYQDSNEVQDAIYRALTSKRRNLFMVGDVKQSIYQFRLADPDIFLEKYASFVPAEAAEPGQDSKVMLSKNFRSGRAVLEAANDVFRLCMCKDVGGLDYGPQEALYEGFDHISIPEPEIEFCAIDVKEHTWPEEAAFAASRISALLDGTHFVREGETLRPIRPEDIVILLRSPGSTGKYFQRALEKLGIRCSFGGGTNLLAAPEIASLLSLLQAIHNPMQDIPLVAAMASPVFGFTADDLAVIRSGNQNCAFYDALRQSALPKAKTFAAMLLQLRQSLSQNSLTGLLEKIYLLTNLEGVYGAMEDGAARLVNLQTFYDLAGQFEASGGRELGRFLEHLEGLGEKGLKTAEEDGAAGSVSIMSIHKSKGLEFPVVFLCGLSKRFNFQDAAQKVLCHKELGLGLSATDKEKRISYPSISKRAIAKRMMADSISEEMRVLYVAMTRAKDRMIMTYASNHLQKLLEDLSRMLRLGQRELLIREAACEGQWVLLTAMHRQEASELFALGGYVPECKPGDPAWNIRVIREDPEARMLEQEQVPLRRMPVEAADNLKRNLSFRYAFDAATRAPSKQTATQRKGREKDQEAAENAEPPKKTRVWRAPSFVEAVQTGAQYGTATHGALQYIRYDRCKDVASTQQEIDRLVEEQYITREQGQMVSAGRIAAFFATDFGKKLQGAPNVQREFKFSILEDGCAYDPALAGEQVLLQGVVDCALLEDDGITVLDFKTDYVTPETIDEVTERYRPQVLAYGQAMERIFEKPVKQMLLYFFSVNQFREIKA